MYVCGTILEIERVSNETDASRLSCFPKIIETLAGITDGGLGSSSEIYAAKEDRSAFCIDKAGVCCVNVVIWNRQASCGRDVLDARHQINALARSTGSSQLRGNLDEGGSIRGLFWVVDVNVFVSKYGNTSALLLVSPFVSDHIEIRYVLDPRDQRITLYF